MREINMEKTTEELVQAYAKRITDTEAKRGREAAIERGQSMLISWSLGREFGETMDSYYERNPEKKGFLEWFKVYKMSA